MSSWSFVSLALVLVGCGDTPSASTASKPVTEPKPEAKTAPEAKQAPPVAGSERTFGYRDFLTLEGIHVRSTLDDVEAAWGDGERTEGYIDYPNGPRVTKNAEGGLMVHIRRDLEPWVAKRAEGPLSIYGKTCEEAARKLDFTDVIGESTTCTHYERDLYVDVTLICNPDGIVDQVVVNWVPFDPATAVDPKPKDRCM